MAIMLQVNDVANELVVTCHIGGGYNPDVLDDVKARVRALYQEALVFRYTAAESMGPQHIDEEMGQ